MVESLDHYTSRIAFVSGITIASLHRTLSPWRSQGQRAKSYVAGMGGRIEAFVEELQQITGQRSLLCGTLHTVSDVLNNYGAGLSGKVRRWCPRCLLEWDHRTSYEPLIWRIPDLDICTVHRCLLRERCEKCGRRQPLPASYVTRRLCVSCGASLAAPGPPANGGARTAYDRHTERCALELVSLCADPYQERVKFADVRPFFDIARAALITTAVPGDVPDLERLLICMRSGRMTTRHLIQLCAIQGVGPRDILLRPVESGSGQLVARVLPAFAYQNTPTNASPPVKLLCNRIKGLQRERRIGMFLPSSSRLLHRVGMGRNEFMDTARVLYHEYRMAYLAQGSAQALRDAERCLSAALARVRGKRFNADNRKFRRCALTVAQESNVSTILARKCVRTALWMGDLERHVRRSWAR
jgi:hypothetical protein